MMTDESSVLDDQCLTTAEVAKLLNVSDGTLRWWRFDRRGPRSFVVGGTIVRYLRSDVEAWLAGQYESTVRGSAR